MRYDVIVVGAGPAGSTTARECATRGLSVLMLDKARFPRDKPCGGGLTVRAAKLLPCNISPVVERVVSGAQFTERQTHPSRRKYSDKISFLTQRYKLDAFLAEKAVEAGVIFRQQETVREIIRNNTLVTLRTDSDLYEGRSLVAADGANGITARLAGLNIKVLHGVGLEGNL